MQYVGIDFHKNYSFITEMDETGVIKCQIKLSNNRNTLTRYIDKLPADTKIGIIFTNSLKTVI
ncbi:MAG TPA: hypothetical protein ENI34_04745 [candidate division WOR-3 bacterium]|uniref:IS110 family transposase n=1 Tax=candidate division WOR-3 bacterium TaxID=2052148 RepID=A0A9C9EM38_UNCW3|nr:hypothetical protein [candidate division WOR-3 bacterium]